MALEAWLCPECKLEQEAKEVDFSTDGDASDYEGAPRRLSAHRSAPRSKKAVSSSASRPKRKRSPAPAPKVTGPHETEIAPEALHRLSGSRQPEATISTKKQQSNWTVTEKDLVRLLMEEVINEKQVNLTEKKWEVISDRLAQRFNVARSKTSVKNYWSREGRLLTGLDERRKPNPEKLVTSVQNPEQRKRARQQTARPSKRKRTDVEEDDNTSEDGEEYRDEAEASDSDEEKGLSTKRQKHN